MLAAACLGERERPGPPQLTFTIDDTTVAASRSDTVTGSIVADDADGIDSVWVILGTDRHPSDGGFNRTFSTRYRFFLPAGQQAGTHIPLSFRARDVAAFETQKDTYVVVVP